MASLIGIDISTDTVRVAALRSSYRKVAISTVAEARISEHETVEDAVRAAVTGIVAKGDSVATVLPGDKLSVRNIQMPATAQRQLVEVLPFELESQLPFELDDAVFDSLQLAREAQGPIVVLACVGRTEQVREQLELVHRATGLEPERVDASHFALSNLAHVVPELAAPGPICVTHLDNDITDVVILRAGKPEFVRTLSAGTAGLPASAEELSRQLRQTLLGWRSQGGAAIEVVYVTGPGTAFAGAEAYLSAQLGIEVKALPPLRIDGITPELAEKLVHHSRAIGLALGLLRGAQSINLRQGPLAYERGFGFLQEKIPLLTAFAALIFVSFLFSTWMHMRSLTHQQEILEEALAIVTKEVVGEAIRDPQMAEDAVNVTTTKYDDPMPTIDAFDVMVELSKAVPTDITHDVDELDFQKNKVSIHGIVESIPEAQQIASTLGQVRCFDNVKIVRTNQVVNENRQKYVLEFDIKCPVEGKAKGDKQAEADKESKEEKEP